MNFFGNLQQFAKKKKVPEDEIVKIIFSDILLRQQNIIKNPNLLYCIIYFCKKTDEKIFEKNFFELLTQFGNDYKQNGIYFEQYLIRFSIEIFFESKNKTNEKNEFFEYIINTDVKNFEGELYKYLNDNKSKNIKL